MPIYPKTYRERVGVDAYAGEGITDHAYWLPMATDVTTYAISRQLNVTACPDELPRFFRSSWK